MDYVKPFLIGGSVIAGSKFLASQPQVGPTLAPLVGGMPTGIIAAFFLQNDDQRRKYYAGYAYSAFVLFLTILAVHMVSDMAIMKTASVRVISVAALVLWAVLSYVTMRVFVKSD